jgi:hypothetical protein
MEFVEIVIDGSVDRDDLEDAIAEAFAGLGEVLPSGLDDDDDGGDGDGDGDGTAALDLELENDLPDDDVLERLFTVIDDLGAGDAVKVRPYDDEDWIRLSDWQA